MFEKLHVLDEKGFYGLKNLQIEFDKSAQEYVNSKFLEKNKNNVLNFIFKFVTINPSNLNYYENEYLNILTQAKKHMENNDISESLLKILELDPKEKFFYKWIYQSKKYLEFMKEIKKLK